MFEDSTYQFVQIYKNFVLQIVDMCSYTLDKSHFTFSKSVSNNILVKISKTLQMMNQIHSIFESKFEANAGAPHSYDESSVRGLKLIVDGILSNKSRNIC